MFRRWMGQLILGRALSDVIYATQKVRVHGVKFVIRKINPMDFMNGSKAIRQIYDTYKVVNPEEVSIAQHHTKQLKDHYAEVFMAAVVEPKLKRNAQEPGDGTPVEHLMTDFGFASELYEKVFEFSYGKKKLISLTSQKSGA